MKIILRILLIAIIIILIVRTTDLIMNFTFYAKIFSQPEDGIHPEFMTGYDNARSIYSLICSIIVFMSDLKPKKIIIAIITIELFSIFFMEMENHYIKSYFLNRFWTYRIWVWLSIIYAVYVSKFFKDHISKFGI
jgi:hypothetical protein